jgi:hypothetical protein
MPSQRSVADSDRPYSAQGRYVRPGRRKILIVVTVLSPHLHLALRFAASSLQRLRVFLWKVDLSADLMGATISENMIVRLSHVSIRTTLEMLFGTMSVHVLH